jgi:uncharacterized protein (DUF433 family)
VSFWAGCELVECIRGKQGGVPLIKGTRIPDDQMIEEWELGSGTEELCANYPSITHDQVPALIAFARRQSITRL